MLTSIEYVANDLRKKQTQFRIGIISVFLTVSFITFLTGLSQLSNIVALKMAVLSAGDFDLVIKKTVDGLPRIHGDVNNYNDQSEFFNLPYVG